MNHRRAAGYGLVLALIQITGTLAFGYSQADPGLVQGGVAVWSGPWMGETLTAGVCLFTALEILKSAEQTARAGIRFLVMASALAVGLASVKVQGLAAGTVILVLGFHGSNRLVLGLGILSLLSWISACYYRLDQTLAEKSLALLTAGLVLLALRLLIRRMAHQREEELDG